MDLESGIRAPSAPGAARTSPLVHRALERDRRRFVRKVYGTVAIQLGATAITAAPIAAASDVWLRAHTSLLTLSSVGLLAMVALLACGGAGILRRHPVNLAVLGGFTLLEAITLGFFCAMFEAQSVLLCLLATAAVALALTAFAFTTSIDATGIGGYLRAASLALFIVGLVACFMHAPLLEVAYAFGGAVLFSGYIVHDTQLVVGGKHSTKQFSIDDYALAALSIYMDLVRLFMFILELIGRERRRSR